MTWKRFQHYWPFVRGIHRSPVDSPHKWTVLMSLYVLFVAREPVVEQTVELPFMLVMTCQIADGAAMQSQSWFLDDKTSYFSGNYMQVKKNQCRVIPPLCPLHPADLYLLLIKVYKNGIVLYHFISCTHGNCSANFESFNFGICMVTLKLTCPLHYVHELIKLCVIQPEEWFK